MLNGPRAGWHWANPDSPAYARSLVRIDRELRSSALDDERRRHSETAHDEHARDVDHLTQLLRAAAALNHAGLVMARGEA